MAHRTKFISLGILIGLVFGIAFAGTRTSAFREVEDEELNAYKTLGVKAAVERYHKRQNDYLNEKIKALVTAEDLAAIDYLPPLQENGVRADCLPENTSTLCVARHMLHEFAVYKRALSQMRGELFEEGQAELISRKKSEAEFGLLFEDAVEKAAEDIDIVDQELRAAEKTLDLTLAAYNELHMAFPLHKKYGELIKALEKYRDDLSDLRSEITFYPVRFFNVTTPQCK